MLTSPNFTRRRYLVHGALGLVCVLAGVMPITVPAQPPASQQARDQVRFSVSVTEEVENDQLLAVIFAQAEAAQAPVAANEVNQAIAWAITQSKAAPAVNLQTLAYRTFPVYGKQRVEGWRVRQSIELKSSDSTALTELLGHLQTRLNLESVHYTLSTTTRETTEQSLVAKAIAAFKVRAAAIADHMGRSGYRLIEMNLGTHNSGPPRPMVRMAAASATSESRTAVRAPTVEAGSQTLNAELSALIELVSATQ